MSRLQLNLWQSPNSAAVHDRFRSDNGSPELCRMKREPILIMAHELTRAKLSPLHECSKMALSIESILLDARLNVSSLSFKNRS